MKKIFGAISLSLLGFIVFPSQGQVAYVAIGAAAAADSVQRCLDLVQLNLARKIAPALHVTSHLVPSPPKDLSTQCPTGSLEEIKSTLKNQIANCERKSAEEKARTFQFGCRMVKNEDYCLNANTEMLKIATLPNMNYTAFVNRAAQEFDWYKSNGAGVNEGRVKVGTTRFPTPLAFKRAAKVRRTDTAFDSPSRLQTLLRPRSDEPQDHVSKIPVCCAIRGQGDQYCPERFWI